VHHSGGVGGFIGIALVILVLLLAAARLARSFRRTSRMLKRDDYWDSFNGPGPRDGGGDAGG
jgi:hypothetical protein